MMNLKVLKLGRMEYGKALKIQEKLQRLRMEDKIEDVLVLLEHPPVLTKGRRTENTHILASEAALKAQGVEIFDVSRGGDVTYHGPGQIVGYPIVKLDCLDKDIKRFVWLVEEVFVRLLKDQFGITALRDEKKYTGVWVENSKITAIGIAVKHWVTMHGFAFNVNTDLSHFYWIVPCGLADRGVTSVQKLLGREIDFEKITELVAEYFCMVFNRNRMDCLLKDLVDHEDLVGLEDY